MAQQAWGRNSQREEEPTGDRTRRAQQSNCIEGKVDSTSRFFTGCGLGDMAIPKWSVDAVQAPHFAAPNPFSTQPY